jgi:hypothetical protein
MSENIHYHFDNLTSSKGPRGPAGPPGPTGPRGLTGPSGTFSQNQYISSLSTVYLNVSNISTGRILMSSIVSPYSSITLSMTPRLISTLIGMS